MQSHLLLLLGPRVEIVCNDALVAKIIETIEQLAKTGYRSAGKIFVSPVEEAVRIETGERGDCVC